MVALYRIYGHWPTQEFNGLGEEEKRLFYVKIKPMKCIQALKRFVLEEFGVHSNPASMDVAGYYPNAGYYPIGYYERRGYDTKEIIDHCRDKREHPFLGMTYRIGPKYTTKVTEVGKAKRALERIAPTFDVLHEIYGKLLGPWGGDAYNSLRHVHTCAEATIASKGAVVFPYRQKWILPKLKAGVQANKKLERLKRFMETKIDSPKKCTTANKDDA